MSRWSPSVGVAPERDEFGDLGDALLQAASIYGARKDKKEAKTEREGDRQREDAYRQRVLQEQEEERQYRHQQDAESRDLRRADLARQGILFKPDPASVYEQTGEEVEVPTVPGLMQGFKFGGVRTRPGMRGLGGGYYEDESRTPEGMARARETAQRAEARDALLRRGYSQADADLIVQGTVSAQDVGPIAKERNEREVSRYNRTTGQSRALEEQAGGPMSAVDVARERTAYDEGTNQQLRLADQLVPNDPLWRPRTGADSANVSTSDSLRKEAMGRMQRRESIFAPTPRGASPTDRLLTPTPPVAPERVRELVASVKREHPDWTAQQVAAEARKRAGTP